MAAKHVPSEEGEPGRETLVGATPARDAPSLGAGKWTRVLLEEQKPGSRAGTARRGTEATAQAPAERGTETARHPSAEELRSKLAAAGQASKNAAALLAASDPATIVEALRELRDGEAPGALQKIISLAGGVIERMLDQRSQPPQAQPVAPEQPLGGPPPDPATANRTPAAKAPDPAPAGTTRSSRSSRP